MPRPGWKARPGRGFRRARRRCLRHRRGTGRPDRGARCCAARLVGCGAGGAKHRLECLRPQHRRGAAGFPRRRPDLSDGRPGSAKALWAISEAGAEYVRHAAREMPGRRSPKTAGCMCRKPTTSRRWPMKQPSLAANSARRSSRGRPTGCARRCVPALFGCIICRAFCLHPLNYALGLAAAAEAAGARIFEDTPVLEIDPAGVRKRVTTPLARVRAAHLVLAGNVHIGSSFRNSPTRCCRSRLIDHHRAARRSVGDVIRYPGAVGDSDRPGAIVSSTAV